MSNQIENEWLIQELANLSAFNSENHQGVYACVTHMCLCIHAATQQHQDRGTKWDIVQDTLNSKAKRLWTIFYAVNAAVVPNQLIGSSFREEMFIISTFWKQLHWVILAHGLSPSRPYLERSIFELRFLLLHKLCLVHWQWRHCLSREWLTQRENSKATQDSSHSALL